MTRPVLSPDDLTEYAFCQGAMHYKQAGHNKRPLVVYAALSGLILGFSRQPVRHPDPLERDCVVKVHMIDVGRAMLGICDIGTMHRQDQKDCVDLAIEIFCRPPQPDNSRVRIQVQSRADRTIVPPAAVCSRIWYRERPDECQAYMAGIDRLILAHPLTSPRPKKGIIQLVR